MIHFSELLQHRTFVRFLYVCASAFVFAIWIWSAESPTTSFNGDSRSTLSAIIYGTAHKPYVQRVVVPIATRTIYTSIPTSLWDSLEQHLLAIPKVQKEMTRLGWEADFLAEYLIALMLAFIALASFPIVVRKLWDHFYDAGNTISAIVPVLTLLILPVAFPSGPHYVYDFPTLFLFTLGFLLLLKRRWLLFYPVFIIGCLNKETMVLLTLAYLVILREAETRQRLVIHLTAQSLCFLAVKAILTIAFSANPGTTLEFHIFGNIHTLLLGYTWTSLLISGVTAVLVFHEFSRKPEQLRRSVVLVGVFGILIFCFGTITELRDLYEVVPLVAFLILHTVFFSYLRLPFYIKPRA